MKRWLAAICAAVLFGMLWRVPAVCAAEEPEIPAAAYALMETETGTLLLESHSGDRLVCGAMAKLMTAYLAAEQVEQGNWTADTVLTATDAVTGTKGAVIWLTAGEEMTVGDLLKGLIVGNANDAAVVLAVAAGGDAETFVMDMNARAFDLGMRDTRFASPQGSPDDGAYTTAADLARLCCALAKQDCLREYFRTWRDFLRGDATELVNENTFARTDETSIGFKACHSESEGWSIAAGAERNGMQCVAVALVRRHGQPLCPGETAAAERVRRVEGGTARIFRGISLSRPDPWRRGTCRAGRTGTAQGTGHPTELRRAGNRDGAARLSPCAGAERAETGQCGVLPGRYPAL